MPKKKSRRDREDNGGANRLIKLGPWVDTILRLMGIFLKR